MNSSSRPISNPVTSNGAALTASSTMQINAESSACKPKITEAEQKLVFFFLLHEFKIYSFKIFIVVLILVLQKPMPALLNHI